MVGQVGARFLAESEIWMTGERAAHGGSERRNAEEDRGEAVAPLAETAMLHMPVPVRKRFRGWWRTLPSLPVGFGGRDGCR